MAAGKELGFGRKERDELKTSTRLAQARRSCLRPRVVRLSSQKEHIAIKRASLELTQVSAFNCNGCTLNVMKT